MTASDMITLATDFAGMSRAEAAKKMGWPKQRLSDKEMRNKVSVSDMLELMEVCKMDIVLRVRETGKETKVFGEGTTMEQNKISFSELLNVLDACEIDVILRVRETGEEVKKLGGAGRRINATIRGEWFDTAKAVAISNDFYKDGVHKYAPHPDSSRELYKLSNGRLLFGVFNEVKKDRVRLATKYEADAFIKQNGTDLYHGRTEEEVKKDE